MKVELTARSATVAIAAFFFAKIVSGLLLLKLSASLLAVADFGVFSQLLLVGALVTSVAIAGAQSGIVREIAVAETESVDRAISAAGLLWLASFVLISVPALLLQSKLSVVLTGTEDYGWQSSLVVIAALLSGPGQIACATLTGLGRVRASLASQALGLIAGTAAAAVFMANGQAANAALAYYGATLLTGLLGWFFVLRVGAIAMVPLAEAWSEASKLLKYAGGFLVVSGSTSLTLFGLRYAYLAAFGQTELGYWLVAQRISDTSTQLLGLFMIQYVVPAYAGSAPEGRRRIVVQGWFIGSATMLSLFLVFAALPHVWIRLLLSSIYFPATSMILTYMAGDIFRCSASLAMNVSLARGRVLAFVGIEMAATALMALITLVLIALNTDRAPVVGYLGAYVAVAASLGVILLVKRRSRLSPTV